MHRTSYGGGNSLEASFNFWFNQAQEETMLICQVNYSDKVAGFYGWYDAHPEEKAVFSYDERIVKNFLLEGTVAVFRVFPKAITVEQLIN